MVLEIIGGIFCPPPGQWSDPEPGYNRVNLPGLDRSTLGTISFLEESGTQGMTEGSWFESLHISEIIAASKIPIRTLSSFLTRYCETSCIE